MTLSVDPDKGTVKPELLAIRQTADEVSESYLKLHVFFFKNLVQQRGRVSCNMLNESWRCSMVRT